MSNAKAEKVRIIVAFGDIAGFSEFCDDITNDEVEYDPLMDRFDAIVESAEKRSGFYFKDTGDGFMCIADLPAGKSACVATCVLCTLWKIYEDIEEVMAVHREDSVCPSGFRIVVTAGYVKRKIKKDGQIIFRGKYINKAHNYLDVARGFGVVVHDSARNLITDAKAKKHGIDFARLKGHPHLSIMKIRSDRRDHASC